MWWLIPIPTIQTANQTDFGLLVDVEATKDDVETVTAIIGKFPPSEVILIRDDGFMAVDVSTLSPADRSVMSLTMPPTYTLDHLGDLPWEAKRWSEERKRFESEVLTREQYREKWVRDPPGSPAKHRRSSSFKAV